MLQNVFDMYRGKSKRNENLKMSFNSNKLVWLQTLLWGEPFDF